MSIDLAATIGGYRPPMGQPGKWQPLGPRKAATKTSMHKLAGQLKERHTGLGAHQHVTDAAHALDRGDHDAAIRHLNAGIANLTPQSMIRHGFTNDADHIQAKISMDDIHRHLLLVKDIQESAARNQELVKAQVPPTQEDEILAPAKAAGAPGAVPPPTAPGAKAPTTPPPAPGAAAKPTPPAPGTAGPAPAPQVASAPQPGTGGKPPPKAVAASNGDITTAIELVGPGGWSHGWKRVGDAIDETADAVNTDDKAGFRADRAKANMHSAATAARSGDHKTAQDLLARVKKDATGSGAQRVPPVMTSQGSLAQLVDQHAAKIEATRLKVARAAAKAAAIEQSNAVELIGPKGSSHGWQQQTPTAGDHEKAARLHLRAAAGARNPATKARHVRMAAVHQQIAAKLRTVNGTAAAAEGGTGGGGDRVNGVEQELAGLPTDQIDLAAAHPPYRFKHGWVPIEGGDTPEVGARKDPPSTQLRARNPSAYAFSQPVELALFHHFDPSELRGKDGEWISSGELAEHAAKDIPDLRDPRDPNMPSPRDKALDAARNGEPHKAARILRQSALAEQAKPDWQRDAGYTAKAKAYADAFGKLPDDSDAETAREGEFLARQTAHPKLTDVEAAKQADALGRMSGRLGKRYPDVAARIDSAAASLRAMDFDTAAQHLRDAQRSSNLSTTPFYDQVPDVPAVRKIQAGLAAARARAEKAAAYSADMKTYGLYQSSIAAATPLELSAKTGALATVSTPISKNPNGPGLWHQKGMGLPPYIRNIAKAIMRKRGMDESHAIAIAKASTGKWAAGGGKVKPEVRAASAVTNADWAAKRARAHAHANAGDYARAIVELTGTAAGAAQDTHGVTGQFAPKGSAQGAKNDKAKSTASAHAKATAAAKAKAHKAHLAHLAHDPKAAGYEKTAATDRAKAKALGAQLKILQAALASASGKVTAGQSGSTTSSSAPAVKKATVAATTTATGAAKGTTAAAATATPTAAQLKTAIASLTKQIAQLNAAAAAATKAAQ
jgi:hypothetical protein